VAYYPVVDGSKFMKYQVLGTAYNSFHMIHIPEFLAWKTAVKTR
jgi:hypothetical protein